MNNSKNNSKKLTVLIVEDNADMRRVISGILQVKGCKTIMTHGYEEALEIIRNESPDIVSCDIQLKGKLSGLDLARTIRKDERTAHLFLIAISGYSGEHERQAALEAGFNMFFSKPVKFADLTRAIETLSNNR